MWSYILIYFGLYISNTDAVIKIPSAEDPVLSKIRSVKPWINQNIALQVSPTARISAFLISAFVVDHISLSLSLSLSHTHTHTHTHKHTHVHAHVCVHGLTLSFPLRPPPPFSHTPPPYPSAQPLSLTPPSFHFKQQWQEKRKISSLTKI